MFSHLFSKKRPLRFANFGFVPKSLHFAALLVFSGFALPLWAQNAVSLENTHWRMSFQNTRANALPQTDDGDWKRVTLPGNLALQKAWGKRKRKTVWLRYHIRQNLSGTHKNLALVIGQVSDHDEVWFNGELIGRSPGQGKIASNYNRPRIYAIPDRLIQEEENLIAIRLKTNFSHTIGLTKGPIRILPLDAAEALILGPEIARFKFTAIYLVSGLFFLILYRRLPHMKEYKWFGIFAFVFGLYQFLTNELRFELFDAFLVYKYLEQLCYLSLPVIYFHFCLHFFKIEKLPGLSLSPRQFAGFYMIFTLAFAVLFAVFFNPVFWDKVISWWLLSALLTAAYLLYYKLNLLFRKLDKDALILLVGSGVLIWYAIDFQGIARGWWDGKPQFHTGLAVFFLSVAFALVFRLIEIQMEVNERKSRLGSVDTMQDRVFKYVNIFLQKPVEHIVSQTREITNENVAAFGFQNSLQELTEEVNTLESRLDDILELSRLEVISEPEFLEPVNFYDFISAVIPTDKITHYIKVNPEIILNTSLELVNSFVVRVIDFPAFKEFPNIDLIITSDLAGRIHFRFMLFHSDVKKTRRLRELLTKLNPERGELWIKWAIIREIIRILNGDLEVRIINRKFLSIDIHLSAEMPVEDGGEDKRQIALLPIASTTAEGLAEIPEAQAAPIGTPKTAAPKFHSKMTLSEFGEWVKSKFTSSRNKHE